MSILVVDDSPIIRERFINLIRLLGCSRLILEADTAEQGLFLCQQNRPVIVVLDIQLPDHSGIELLKKIKDTSPSTRVVMFTNFPFEQHRDRCLQAGADHFFDKSDEFESAVTTVQALSLQL